MWNFTAMIYSLSKGQDKSRCRSSGGLQERVGFSGVIVFSGENSLFAQGTQNLGTHARMTEITLPWTDSADHAERLSKGFRKNYGHAVAPFIEKLLEIFSENPKKLEILFERELEILLAMAGNVSSVEKRIFNAYATVLVAAEVAKKALRLNFDVTSVRKVLIENFKKKLLS